MRSGIGTSSTATSSPNQTLMKKVAISLRCRRQSGGPPGGIRAKLDKTLQEVILRSKLEAERHEADRLRKLMLDTAMASELSKRTISIIIYAPAYGT